VGRAREQEEDEKYVALGEMDVSVAGGSGGEGLEMRELADGDGEGALLNGAGTNPRQVQQLKDEWDESKDDGLRVVSSLPTLTSLDLADRTRVSDEGVRGVSSLPVLSYHSPASTPSHARAALSDMDEEGDAGEGRREAVRAGGGAAAAAATRGGDFARLVHEVTWRNRSTMVSVCGCVAVCVGCWAWGQGTRA
jgi:hypothetical protein